MPVAIDLYTYVAVSSRADRQLRIYSQSFDETRDLDLDSIRPGKSSHWSDYVRGVAGVLESSGHRLRGADLAIASEVPLGSGLSSSAALEVSVAFALLGNSQINVDRKAIPQVCQQAEHLYPETKCGVMDQFIACYGRAGHALILDCRSLDFHHLALPSDVKLLVCNTMVRHEHATSGYNTRRQECEVGLRALTKVLPGIRALRDVGLEALAKHSDRLSPVICKRVRHVVTENDRVNQAASALRNADLSQFGRLMAESHRSLRDDYEVSSPELDLMVELANDRKGVYGTRMTGGGFGGSAVALVHAAHAEDVRRSLAQRYEAKTRLKPEILICEASDGAGPVAEN
jgi:galactokinase